MPVDSHPPQTTLDASARRSTRFRWSLRTTFLFALATSILVAVLVLLFVKQSLWVELDIILGTLGVATFLFFFVVLFRGVRFNAQKGYFLGWVHPRTCLDAAQSIDGFVGFAEAGSDCLMGFLLGLLIDFLVSLALVFVVAFLVWAAANVVIAAAGAVLLPLYYLFRRSVRYVAARGRSCRGRLGASMVWAAAYAAGNIAWLYAILVLGQFVASL